MPIFQSNINDIISLNILGGMSPFKLQEKLRWWVYMSP